MRVLFFVTLKVFSQKNYYTFTIVINQLVDVKNFRVIAPEIKDYSER